MLPKQTVNALLTVRGYAWVKMSVLHTVLPETHERPNWPENPSPTKDLQLVLFEIQFWLSKKRMEALYRNRTTPSL